MSKKKAVKNENNAHNIVLVAALIQLITAIISLIEKLIE